VWDWVQVVVDSKNPNEILLVVLVFNRVIKRIKNVGKRVHLYNPRGEQDP